MNELSNEEKIKLGHEAFEAFLENFKPIDQYSIVFLEVLFAVLKGKYE